MKNNIFEFSMTVSEQAGIILEAVEHELVGVDGIVRWADSTITLTEKPAPWLLELSTQHPSNITGFIGVLRAHATDSLPLRLRVQVILLAYYAGLLSLASSLPLLFRVLFFERNGAEPDSSDAQLIDALIQWDCQENLDVIPPALCAKFETLFSRYLADANQISAILHWRH